MKTIQTVRMADGLPRILTQQPWVQAMSYAAGKLFTRVLCYAELAALYASVDTMPKGILDVMAMEQRVPNYEQSMDAATKKVLIKSAIPFWEHAGTNSAMASMIEKIFGDADVSEWYDYGGAPFGFKISTENPSITGGMVENFKEAVKNVKRMTAHLDGVESSLSTPDGASYFGAAIRDYAEIEMKMEVTA